MRIVTDYFAKPLPTREFDWSAVDGDTYDGSKDSHCPIGYGATEAEAIADLMSQAEGEMTLADALFSIREDMARLVSAMVAKGHGKARASFEIDADGRLTIRLHTEGVKAFRPIYGGSSRHDFEWVRGTAYANDARKAVAELLDETPEIACAAWFDMAQIAEAAE